jgi:Activator of Hsp90 ATPase homolog 1-like protein
MMKDRNFSTAFTIDQTPEEAFAAINNVREWWAGKPGIEGSTDKLGDEFTYAYEPHHYSKQKVTELIPGKKVVWLVLESQLNFVKDKSEWNSTKVTFEIAKKGDKTEVRFTHQGLVPDYECYGACSNAWGSIINRSLRSLITTGVAEKSSLSGRARSNPVGG